MKKIPTVDDLAADTASEENAPMLPGTEQPRSLGDLMREAEAESAQQEGNGEAIDGAEPATKPRRSKRPNRAQTRRFARERALQALYQWDVSNSQSTTVRTDFLDNQDMSRVDVEYFTLLFNGVSHHPQAVDDALKDSLDRPIEDLDPIERAVLRIAAFELSQQPEIPARVIINEGIEITKRFGADKGHRYVNGVLDKLANSLRAQEMRRK